jgi:hypothetical protein
MIYASLAELIASVRFQSLLMLPLSDGLGEGPAQQIERLANVASVLAARPSPNIARSLDLQSAANRGHAVARIFPELTRLERPAWAIAEITAIIAVIERCRRDVEFPTVLDELLIGAHLTVDILGLNHRSARAA